VAGLVLGDDQGVFLDALSTVLHQSGHDVLGAGQSGPAVVELVRRLRPDICLLDRRFASPDGGLLIAPLRQASPATKVMVLSSEHDVEGMRHALSAGASGYLHKSRGVAALIGAIDQVLSGQVAVDLPDTATRLSPPAGIDEDCRAVRRLAAHLTPRERQCLRLLADGLDTPAIMGRLGVSRTTVRTHVQAVLFKLGVHSRLQAVSLALRHGLLDDVSDAAGPAGRSASAV
jgi:two-component system, NarL family, nitrate/nitrite response regulator NarL